MLHEWWPYLTQAIGLLGVKLMLVAYFQLQRGKWTQESRLFLGANALGALLVIVSLLEDWNLPAFLMESVWFAISVYGLWKYRTAKSVAD